jgi:hypothetical protein
MNSIYNMNDYSPPPVVPLCPVVLLLIVSMSLSLLTAHLRTHSDAPSTRSVGQPRSLASHPSVPTFDRDSTIVVRSSG